MSSMQERGRPSTKGCWDTETNIDNYEIGNISGFFDDTAHSLVITYDNIPQLTHSAKCMSASYEPNIWVLITAALCGILVSYRFIRSYFAILHIILHAYGGNL